MIDSKWTKVIEDSQAWKDNKEFRWTYDRLLIAQTQNYNCGPSGLDPENYPVIMKPITTLYGMGIGIKIINDESDLIYTPGYMWADILYGTHVSTDLIVENGKILWIAQSIGVPSDTMGRFDLWILKKDYISKELEIIQKWIIRYINDYSGPLNVETIDGNIIEMHLRLSMDWQNAGCYKNYDKLDANYLGIPMYGNTFNDFNIENLIVNNQKENDRKFMLFLLFILLLIYLIIGCITRIGFVILMPMFVVWTLKQFIVEALLWPYLFYLIVTGKL